MIGREPAESGQHKARARKALHRVQKEVILKQRKRQLESLVLKRRGKEISVGETEDALVEVKSKSPDFAKVRQIEDRLKTEIASLKAEKRQIEGIIRLSEALNYANAAVFRQALEEHESAIRHNQEFLELLGDLRKAKEMRRGKQ